MRLGFLLAASCFVFLCSGSGAESSPIVGRIEQIADPDSVLPLNLTQVESARNTLIPERPQIDESSPLDGAVKLTLPDYASGIWGGNLTITCREIFQPDPTDASLRKGESGAAVFRFIKEPDRVWVMPAVLFFAARQERWEDYQLARIPDGTPHPKVVKPFKTVQSFPVISLGLAKYHTIAGTGWSDVLTHNSSRPLADNTVEQDVVCKRLKENIVYGYRESIIRFSWQNERLIFVKAAIADFAPDRSIRKTTTIEGYLTPNWQRTSAEIVEITRRPWSELVKVFYLNLPSDN